MNFARFLARITLMLVIPLLAAALTFFLLKGYFLDPVDSSNTEPVYVQITADKPFQQFCEELQEKGLVSHWRVIALLAKLKGENAQIPEGEYELTPSMTPREILSHLTEGKIYLRNVVIEPGSSIWSIGAKLEEVGLATEKDFNQAIVNPELLAMAGLRAESFEGYLFPGEYEFTATHSIQHIIWSMLKRLEEFWQANNLDELSREKKISRHEVLTLASIAEQETDDVDDRKKVASVLINRLNNGMKLEADAAVRYGLRNPPDVLSDIERQQPTPYNTYLNFGLPPTPTCNPSEASILAVLSKDNPDLLFYTHSKNGSLVFSATRREYEIAKSEYNDYVAKQLMDSGVRLEPKPVRIEEAGL